MANSYQIVNGTQLPSHTNQKVSITGFVSKTTPKALFFELRAADNVMVRINFKKPLETQIEGYIEVHGMSQGKSVTADNYIIFGNQDFDAQSHSTLCTLLYSIPNLWNTRKAL